MSASLQTDPFEELQVQDFIQGLHRCVINEPVNQTETDVKAAELKTRRFIQAGSPLNVAGVCRGESVLVKLLQDARGRTLHFGFRLSC